MANVPKSGISIKVPLYGPIIPYLIFANDCAIFCETNRKAARTVKAI